MPTYAIEHQAPAASKAFVLAALLLLGSALAVPARAATGPTITGGGSANDMTRFALAIHGGTGHFECLMPAVMTVEATVSGVDSSNSATASFHGVAAVTLAANNPFGLPAGPMARGVSFTASVVAGGPGKGFSIWRSWGCPLRARSSTGRSRSARSANVLVNLLYP